MEVTQQKLNEIHLDGRRMQQLRLAKIVKTHLPEMLNAPAKTELEIVMKAIVKQFIEAFEQEGNNIK